jgi:hypothetical protein
MRLTSRSFSGLSTSSSERCLYTGTMRLTSRSFSGLSASPRERCLYTGTMRLTSRSFSGLSASPRERCLYTGTMRLTSRSFSGLSTAPRISPVLSFLGWYHTMRCWINIHSSPLFSLARRINTHSDTLVLSVSHSPDPHHSGTLVPRSPDNTSRRFRGRLAAFHSQSR